MKELSLHILDIIQNSIHAHPSLIQLEVIENTMENKLIIVVEDNGTGMDNELKEKILDPFVTTRNTRKVGLGLPLLQAATQRCQGNLCITSKKSKGTMLRASFQYDHIDRAPLGNMTETLISIIMALEKIDLLYTHEYNQSKFILDTREIRNLLGQDIALSETEVVLWLKEYVKDGIENIYRGVEK